MSAAKLSIIIEVAGDIDIPLRICHRSLGLRGCAAKPGGKLGVAVGVVTREILPPAIGDGNGKGAEDGVGAVSRPDQEHVGARNGNFRIIVNLPLGIQRI